MGDDRDILRHRQVERLERAVNAFGNQDVAADDRGRFRLTSGEHLRGGDHAQGVGHPPGADQPGHLGQAGRGQRLAVALGAERGEGEGLVGIDQRDPAVALADQVVGQHPADAQVVDVHEGIGGVQFAPSVDHEGHAEILKAADAKVVAARVGQDEAVKSPAKREALIDRDNVLPGRIRGQVQHELHLAFREAGGQAGHRLEKDRVPGNPGIGPLDEADHAGTPRHEPPCRHIRHVFQFLGRLLDAQAGGLADIRMAVQGPADLGHRQPQMAAQVLQRGHRSALPPGASSPPVARGVPAETFRRPPLPASAQSAPTGFRNVPGHSATTSRAWEPATRGIPLRPDHRTLTTAFASGTAARLDCPPASG